MELNINPEGSFFSSATLHKSESVIMIPVVVHVVYRNATENISDAVIRNQIEILNNDFRRINSDRVNTPSDFATLAADTRIQFYLACRDPQGNPHSGIIRKQSTHTNTTVGADNRFIAENNTVAFDSEGGSNSWDNTKYLNIYVADIYSLTAGNSLIGRGHWPHQIFTLNQESPNATRSNVVSVVQMDYTAFLDQQNLGRVLTHETGHWLELRHIWGEMSYATCNDNDIVDDTPNQNYLTRGCLTHPYNDGCSSAIMFMNYMDYTSSNCMNMFTNGQKNRMRNCLSPSADPSVRRVLAYDEVYLESSSSLDYMNPIIEERTFTLRGAGASATANWTLSPSLTLVSQTPTTITVKAKDGFTTAWVQASVNNFGVCSNVSVADFRIDMTLRPTIVLGTCYNPNFQGIKDRITCSEMSGWAYNSLDQSFASEVNIMVDNTTVATLSASAGKTHPSSSQLYSHGFYYYPSADATWKNNANHLITLRGCEGQVFATQLLNCPSPTIFADFNSWYPASNAQTRQVTINASASWTATSNASSWLTVSNVSSQGFTLNVTDNSGVERIGTVTISSGVSSYTITVTQGTSSGGVCPANEVALGASGSDEVVLRHFDNYYVVCQKYMNGSQLVYIPRGANFLTDWSSFSRYANTQQYDACINVGSTAWWGLINPLPSNYVPSGWALGSFSDGTQYFYQVTNPCPANEVALGTSGNDQVVLKHFDNYYVVCQKYMNGSQLTYIPRGTNFLTDWSGFSRYANTQMFDACINVGSTAWWGLVNPLPSNYTPSGWTSGSFSDGTKYFYNPNAGRRAIDANVLDEPSSQFDVTISPNPTTGKVVLDFVLEDANPLRINVYDSQGKNLLIYDLEGKSGGNSIPLDLSTFSTGSYLLNVQTGNKQSTKRVIKID